MNDFETTKRLAKLIRWLILTSTSHAGSGHPTSSLSAVELMTVLFFGGYFRYDIQNPQHPGNDHIIFSKGHAAPLLYSLFAASGAIELDELQNLRQKGSRLEGHPSLQFPFCEVATGSLGQGIGIGYGMALGDQLMNRSERRTFVLLGDGEMSEGSVWETLNIAAKRLVSNLIGIIDMNGLGQTGETYFGRNPIDLKGKIEAFGWNTIVIGNGHSLKHIHAGFAEAMKERKKPVMIIAKTVKGKGISFLEDKTDWHGKALSPLSLRQALKELGRVHFHVRGKIAKPSPRKQFRFPSPKKIFPPHIEKEQTLSTRQAFGNALVRLFPAARHLIVCDVDVGNSTKTDEFQKKFPHRFLQFGIAEQTALSACLGLSKVGFKPCFATFSAFLSRAHDQIRMSQYSEPNMIIMGSHSGVATGADGPSQMGLEDIAMFRSMNKTVVLQPSDAVSCEMLVERAISFKGLVYLRCFRPQVPIIYSQKHEFRIGGSHVLKKSRHDRITVIASGFPVNFALQASLECEKIGIRVRVIDCYSIKPIDSETLQKASRETKGLIVLEDHYPEGGLGEAVRSSLNHQKCPVISVAVSDIPHSASTMELADDFSISKKGIMEKIKKFIEQEKNIA